MTIELTDTGLSIDTQAEIKAAMEAAQRLNISDRLDVSTTSPHAQHNAVVSRQIRLEHEAALALYMALDPDSARGDALDRLGAITGTLREPASETRTSVVVNVDPGTYAIGALVAQVTGRPDQTFSNIEAVTNSGGSAADFTVLFDADDTGPISCPQDTLAIAGPVTGWNSIVSNTEGELGSDVEADGPYRRRRNTEVANPGSTSAAGIAADISQNVPDVDSVTVIENVTAEVVDSIPAYGIEAIVSGPDSPSTADNLAVATQILASKAAGTPTYGNTAVDVTDSQGQVQTVNFTRPTIQDLVVTIAVDVDNTYAGDTALAEAIALAADAAFRPGLDGAGSLIAAWAHDVQGVLRVTDVTIDAGASFGVVAIANRVKARIQSGNVTPTSTEAVA